MKTHTVKLPDNALANNTNITIKVNVSDAENTRAKVFTVKAMGKSPTDADDCYKYIINPSRRNEIADEARKLQFINPAFESFTVYPEPLNEKGVTIKTMSCNKDDIYGYQAKFEVTNVTS